MKTMKIYVQRITLSVCFLVATINAYAQMTIGPGAGATNGSASLEIKAGPYSSGSSYRGLLPPTVTTIQRSQIQNPATGLLVFNTTTNQIEVNTGSTNSPVWTPGGATGTTSAEAWNLAGNSGTGNANFLGTIDNVPLRFRVNNQNAGRIDQLTNSTALGYLALSIGSTGQGNTALGTLSLANVTSGNYNTATGLQTLQNNTTGTGNTALGTVALLANTSGQFNTASGYKSLYSNTTGIGNTATGAVTLENNTSGDNNTAMGQVALQANTSGSRNTALGAGALQRNTTGYENQAVGHNAASNNTTGYSNLAVGTDALLTNTGGNDNTALGGSSLLNNTTGNGNVATGNLALRNTTTGSGNTAVGVLALRYNTTGSNNTALGVGAGVLEANSNLSNSTVIGANAVVSASNTIVLGNNLITSLRCNVQSISSLSDKRIKENIQANVPGLSFVTKLTPVTYHINKTKEAKLVGYSLDNIHEDKVLHSGFLAQDVEAAAQAVGYNFEGVRQEEGGKYYTLGYTLFVMPLVQAVKELNAEVNQLKAELAAAKQIEKATQARLDKIEALLQNPAPHAAMSFNAK